MKSHASIRYLTTFWLWERLLPIRWQDLACNHVFDGIAYAIVPGSGDREITLPEIESADAENKVTEPETAPSTGSDAVEPERNTDQPISTPPTSRSLIYVSLAAVLVLLGGLAVGRMRG